MKGMHVHYSTYSTAAIRQWLTVAVQTERPLENSKISIVKWYDVHHFLVGKIYDHNYAHDVLRERKKERKKERKRERERSTHVHTEREQYKGTQIGESLFIHTIHQRMEHTYC